MLRLVFLVFFLNVSAVAAPAESDGSVYRISPLADAALISAGVLGTVLSYGAVHPQHVCPCNANDVNGFDRGAIGNDSATARAVSDVVVGAAILAPLGLDWLTFGWSSTFLEDAVIFAEVLAINSGLVAIVKHAVQRPIPLAYSGQLAGDDEGYRSFYSGHASTAFAALSATAMTLNLRYDWGAGPWVAALGLGGTVAVARVLGGNHFPTDVLVGGIVGTGIGMLVPWLHRRSGDAERVLITPTAGGGMQLLYLARF